MQDKGKRETQSMEEMLQDMAQARERGLAPGRGQKVYKAANGEYNEGKLRELISCGMDDLVNYATKERVSLGDLEEVQRRTVLYLRACFDAGAFPSCLGLARSLGYTDRALRMWRKNKADTPTAQFLEMFNDLCSDILNQSALKGNANNVFSIFLGKALYGLRETSELVISPAQMEDGPDYSAEDIRKRYLTE